MYDTFKPILARMTEDVSCLDQNDQIVKQLASDIKHLYGMVVLIGQLNDEMERALQKEFKSRFKR